MSNSHKDQIPWNKGLRYFNNNGNGAIIYG